MQAQLIRPLTWGPSAPKALRHTTAAAGTVLDSPQAWEIVAAGHAVPHDAECCEAVWRDQFPREPIEAGGLSEEQRTTLRAHVETLIRRGEPIARGIHPDDYNAFYAGEMDGYDPETGEPLPGPNAEYSGSIALR